MKKRLIGFAAVFLSLLSTNVAAQFDGFFQGTASQPSVPPQCQNMASAGAALSCACTAWSAQGFLCPGLWTAISPIGQQPFWVPDDFGGRPHCTIPGQNG